MQTIRNWDKKLAGFTLIELVVVIAIIGILAAIAYPSYIDQVRKSRRSTGKAALLDVAARMEQYYLDNKSYSIANLTSIGLTSPCTSTLTSSCISSDGLTYTSPDGGWYGITAAVTTTPPGYVLTATPTLGLDQANDTRCATLTFNNKQEKKSTPAGNSCW